MTPQLGQIGSRLYAKGEHDKGPWFDQRANRDCGNGAVGNLRVLAQDLLDQDSIAVSPQSSFVLSSFFAQSTGVANSRRRRARLRLLSAAWRRSC